MTCINRTTNAVIPLDFSLGRACLACPVCGENYVHPTGVTCLPPGAIGRGLLKVDASGIHLDPSVKPTARGVHIALEFLCEHGHVFAYRLEFHKGQTYVTRTEDHAGNENWPTATIWRN